MSNAVISVVTGTYNRLSYLQAMMDSAIRSAGDVPIEFIIVDGGSTDGTVEWCKRRQDVTLVEQHELVGATKAFAAGFSRVRTPFVCPLNDDIELLGDTIKVSLDHLYNNPLCGAVAYVNQSPDGKEYLMHPYGYATPQCGMVRTWVGDLVGWWSTEYHTYAADTEMGLKIWELGLSVCELPGCKILDKQPQDDLRKRNDGMRNRNNDHPDNIKFKERWNGRMPPVSRYNSIPRDTCWQKAQKHALRTLRFKIHPRNTGPVRTGMIRAFEKYGDAMQIVLDDHAHLMSRKPQKYQAWVQAEVDNFEPDLVLFQIQGSGSISPQTVRELRENYPNTIFVNFNGDVRNEVEQVLIDVAKECHLTLLPSPDLFTEYHNRGATRVAYWPIAVDPEYLEAKRGRDGFEYDVVFLGSHYPSTQFPLMQERYDTVEALVKSGLRVGLFGFGWPQEWKARYTADNTEENIRIYERAKLAVSISQFDLWGYTSDRLYRICATGTPAVVKAFRGMDEHGFVRDENCAAFDNADAAIETCRRLLAADDEREAIAQAGRRLVIERHNYDRRVESLLLMLENL